MEALHPTYLSQLSTIRNNIQESDILKKYLEEEEEEFYAELKNAFEPLIDEVYTAVADKYPLQLIALEEELTNPEYEGLFLPRVLGYTVLRGEIDEIYKYKRPQAHFKKLLHAISGSSNFDLIKNRIGQSVQLGFAFSSDIWITNFLNEISNKKVNNFFTSLRNERFRDVRDRHTFFLKYGKQFQSLNYQTAIFPTDLKELRIHSSSLKSFLLYRANSDFDNSSLRTFLKAFIDRDEFVGEHQFTELLMIIGMFADLDDTYKKKASGHFDTLRKGEEFDHKYFNMLVEFLKDEEVEIGGKQELRISNLLNKATDDEITKYYTLMDQVHGKGYVLDEVVEAVRVYYYQNEGLSQQNECVRSIIIHYFSAFLSNLSVETYQDYFEINKTFAQYMGIFNNEKFNQAIKNISLTYVKKLIKKYTDKRGRDYQDIKKFVATNFLDLGFMKQKDIVELFKTRRKKTPTA